MGWDKARYTSIRPRLGGGGSVARAAGRLAAVRDLSVLLVGLGRGCLPRGSSGRVPRGRVGKNADAVTQTATCVNLDRMEPIQNAW